MPYDFTHRWNLGNKTKEKKDTNQKKKTKQNRVLTIKNKGYQRGGEWEDR